MLALMFVFICLEDTHGPGRMGAQFSLRGYEDLSGALAASASSKLEKTQVEGIFTCSKLGKSEHRQPASLSSHRQVFQTRTPKVDHLDWGCLQESDSHKSGIQNIYFPRIPVLSRVSQCFCLQRYMCARFSLRCVCSRDIYCSSNGHGHN